MWNCFVLAIFTLCSLQPSNAADLVFYKGSLDNTVSAPLSSPLPTFNSTLIDSTLPCLIYAFGYQGKKNGRATTSMIQAFVQTRKRNVFLANWEKEAASGLLGIPLGYALSAAPNAKKIGNQLGDAIVILLKAGLCLSFHLIGHSLGAHVMGYAGKRVRGAGKVVDRITGLDPARALHEGSFAMYTGVDRTCAKFVDIVHTDPGGYGYSNAAGTVDLWPNYVGSDGTQPGCPSGDYAMFTPEDLCSHDRSWQLYSEAIGAPTSMPAAAASDADAWRAARSVAETTYLGELTSISARGNFYLTTNAQSLFARGQAGLIADTNESRKRRHSTALTRLLKYLR